MANEEVKGHKTISILSVLSFLLIFKINFGLNQIKFKMIIKFLLIYINNYVFCLYNIGYVHLLISWGVF